MMRHHRSLPFRPGRRDFLRCTAALAAGSLGARRSSAQDSIADERKRIKRVVIIGAGISGLAAANRLVGEFGLGRRDQVIVLEARNRLGGRMHSDRSLGYSVEQGAAWIVGSNTNPISVLAENIGASLYTTDWESINVYDIDGSKISTGRYNAGYDRYINILQDVIAYRNGLSNDQSFRQSLIDINAGAGLSNLNERVLELNYWWELEADWNSSLEDLSTMQFDMGDAFAGPDKILRDGYDLIPSSLAQGLDVRLDHVVEEVALAGNSVLVHTDHGTFKADACICTLPLGVLKQGNVLFSPSLPSSTQQAIDSIGFGRVFKMTLEFPDVFWTGNREFYGYMSNDRDENVMFQNVERINGGAALLMWSQNDYAVMLENMTLSEATNRVMTDLKTIFGASIPDPSNVLTSGWINSPYTGGSYTFPKVGTLPVDFDVFNTPIRNKLYFAGEHTSSNYPGTVHGAYFSGLNVAAAVMARP